MLVYCSIWLLKLDWVKSSNYLCIVCIYLITNRADTESENHDESETACCFALCGVIHSLSPLTESESAVDSCMMSLDLWICYTVTALSPHQSAGSFTDPRPLSQTLTSGSYLTC